MIRKPHRLALAALFTLIVFAGGCGRRHRAISAPPPPTAPAIAPRPETALRADSRTDAEFVETHPPIRTEVGMASWYGTPYHNRRAANGKIYRQDQLSAAHRTLPLNTLIKVTNLSNGRSAIMRVTDRGPFVPGRILDLSRGSAEAIGMLRQGIARVRIDVYAAPSPLDTGGRWCVQIGAFVNGREARKLRDRLTRRYRSANVVDFRGPTGYWVRIRPPNDDKTAAAEIARNLQSAEGEAYLVRLN